MTSEISSLRSALIVDDLRFNRTLLKHTLTALRYTVTEAVDGTEAIHQLNRQPFDIVFLDWELPGGLKGDHVARHLREDPAHASTLLIAITNDTSPAMRARCAEAGTDAFLGKALDSASVQNAIEAAGGLHPSTRTPSSSISTATVARIRETLGSYARQFPGGMPEALRHCREEFVSEHRLLRTAASAALWTEAARAAHNLGALAAIIGLPEIKQVAHTAEDALRRADQAEIAPALAEIDAFVERVCLALSSPAAEVDHGLTGPNA